jgi:hypothetical protein
MSCTASAAWSRHVSIPCYTEHGQHCGAVLSGRINTVAMPRSGQLGLRRTVEPNCSGLSARLAGGSVTRDHALDICEPSCVPRAARHFFIHVVHIPLGGVGYVAAPELSSRGGEAGATWQLRAHLGREARFGAEEHVAASELSSRGGRARSHGIRGNAKAHLSKEARPGAEEHVTALELNSARRRGPGPRGNTGAHLSKEVRSGATGHVAPPEPTSAGRCGPKVQLAWQRVDARPAPCLDLELVCGGTRSSGCRQRPPGPPRERLRTHRWSQFFDVRLSYLDLFTRGAVDGGPPGGAKARGPGAPTINAKKLHRQAPGRCRS